MFFLPQTNEVIKQEQVLAMKRLQSNKPAGLVRWGSGGQRLNREELFAALNRINTGAGQSERSSRSRYAHSHWNDQWLRYVTQLLHGIGQQSLENSATFPNGLRDEVAVGRKLIREEVMTRSNNSLEIRLRWNGEDVCSHFFFLDEAISTLRITNTLATERRNLLVTFTASSLRPGVYLFCSSLTSVLSKVSMN